MNIGIVGLGPHGANHATYLTELGHDILGVDADPEARQKFEEQYNSTTYESLDDLYDAGLDAVIISTPNRFHEGAALKAFDAGFDVLLEKPLADDLESAERIVEAAAEAGNICMIGFHNRFRNLTRITESYIQDGYFGDVSHIDAKFVRRRGVPGRGTWYTSNEIAGGGVVIDIGGHVFDMILNFLDWPELTDMMATTRSEFGHRTDYSYIDMYGQDGEANMYDVEDTMTAFFEFEGGQTAHIEVAWAANTQKVHSYDIRGTEAGASLELTNLLDPVDHTQEYRRKLDMYEVRNGGVDHFVNSEVVAERNDPYKDELSAFLSAVGSGERPERCHARQALRAQRIIDRVYDEAGVSDTGP